MANLGRYFCATNLSKTSYFRHVPILQGFELSLGKFCLNIFPQNSKWTWGYSENILELWSHSNYLADCCWQCSYLVVFPSDWNNDLWRSSISSVHQSFRMAKVWTSILSFYKLFYQLVVSTNFFNYIFYQLSWYIVGSLSFPVVVLGKVPKWVGWDKWQDKRWFIWVLWVLV